MIYVLNNYRLYLDNIDIIFHIFFNFKHNFLKQTKIIKRTHKTWELQFNEEIYIIEHCIKLYKM